MHDTNQFVLFTFLSPRTEHPLITVRPTVGH